MLHLLSQTPSKFHSRSATLPDAFDSATGPVDERNRRQQPESHVKGLPLDIPSTIPETSSPAPPIRAHHRSFTEDVRSPRDFPPLTTTPGNSFQASHIHRLDSSTPLRDFSHSPESSRRGSPTRNSNEISYTNTEQVTKAKKLSSWFEGESHPIKVSLVPSPSRENANPLDSTTIATSTRPSGVLHRKSTSQVLPAMASRFSLFNSKTSLSKPTPSKSEHGEDELAECDIHNALFPNGMPDPSSAAAFKSLQQQAEMLLTRLQAAYKERASALKETLAEKEALNEETQGAETRARHLKMQLDAMAEQLAEQDKAMMTMVDELAQEKLARREEEEARKRSVRLVEREFMPPTAHRSRPRISTISDSGLESEDESSAESVFSRPDGTYSPTMSMSSVSTDNSHDMFHSRDSLHSPTHAARLRIPTHTTKFSQQSCNNCHSVRLSDPGTAVGVLKEENQGLKQRIGDLEGTLDGCLDIVGRLGG